jgi:hypothetical protein
MLENTKLAINNEQSRETGRDTINVREYQMGNQQWTIQRNWQRYNKIVSLPVSLDYPLLIAHSVFSNIYCISASFSGLSIVDCPFGIL